MLKEKIVKRLDDFIEEMSGFTDSANGFYVSWGQYDSFLVKVRAFCSTFLKPNNYYLKGLVGEKYELNGYYMTLLLGLLKGLRKDVEGGFVDDIKGLIAGEIFTNFIEMSEHLLDEGYKDAAAVIIGSVLENAIKEACLKNNIPITRYDNNTGKDVPINMENLNIELAKADIYNKLVQKSVTANLDLRNKAAHGHYSEYDKTQVEIMLLFVSDFAGKYL